MDDDWEIAADREIALNNKWKGEDEVEDVKDSWEEEDEVEKKDEEKIEPVIKAATKTKTKTNKNAGQERLQDDDESKDSTNMTSEEKLAEKIRLQKIQEEADLKSALDTFGVTPTGLESFNPTTKEEFKNFGATLSWKIAQYKDSPHFPLFIEELLHKIYLELPLAELKKAKISVECLYTEKLKLEQKQTTKKASKNKNRPTIIKVGDLFDYREYGNYENDDYEDFM